MPPGPFPLPLFGNLSVYFFQSGYYMDRLSQLSTKFGRISTVWLGTKPLIFINEFELAKIVFNDKSMDLNGRGSEMLKWVIQPGKDGGVLLADPSPRFNVLRKVCHKAIRKFITNESLSELTAQVVDYYIKSFKSRVDLNSPFNPRDLLDDINLRIIASLTLGIRKSDDFDEHSNIIFHYKRIGKNIDQLGVAYYVPILLPFKIKHYIQCKTSFDEIQTIIAKSFERHVSEYRDNKIDDFCDALLYQRKEMLNENKALADQLKDEDLHMLSYDLFIAGMETNKHTMRWIFLFMAYYPEMQIQMRNEIKNNIGIGMPLLEDKEKCHFTNAFINEVMRFRNITPIGVPHKAMRNTKIDNYEIPKGAMIISFTHHYMFDPNLWKDPKVFDPKRFLKEGKLDMQSFPNYQPFGVGRRSCLGDKFSLNMIFLIMSRIFQCTENQLFCLPNGPQSADLSPNNKVIAQTAKRFSLVLKQQNSL